MLLIVLLFPALLSRPRLNRTLHTKAWYPRSMAVLPTSTDVLKPFGFFLIESIRLFLTQVGFLA